ncbi:TetR/AcrR family transcriptional regulator [Nocardia mexicana]|uniref:TetR family transcriptional regulator n=1 Tax=Nocardia mexicana TaxID=279262 RepID=A0A370GNQ1_9NOCA|nr:TetR/AcrR family transcriptional regulator [Nocardia mexicana]RDI45372.1 TetR family transcriptional regulator [Nocardia mexicana]
MKLEGVLVIDISRAESLRPPRLGPASDRLSPRLREILDDLDDLFHAEGFSQFKVGELAERVHCSRRTLYELAPTKEELVLVVLDRRLRKISREARVALKEVDDPVELLERFHAPSHRDLRRSTMRFAEDVASHPAVQRLFADHHRYAVALLREIIETGKKLGEFGDVHSGVVAEVWDAALERFQEPRFLREYNLTFEDAAIELSRLLRFGLTLSATQGVHH